MRKPTILLTVAGIKVYVMSNHSEQQIVIVITTWWGHMLGREKQRIGKNHTEFIQRGSISSRR